MADIGNHFQVDINSLLSNEKAVFQGNKYRITVLSDRLIRFEYNVNGKFNDFPTSFAANRKFNLPQFEVDQDEKYLAIYSKYFLLKYRKEAPFKGSTLAPDSNLSVRLNNTDKMWYPNHPEARNFKSSTVSLDAITNKLQKGLYSTDGFAMIDDSHSFLIDNNGYLNDNNSGGLDFYLFMYKRDFGLCLNDYFKLTKKPALLPRYALGVWWNKEMIYSARDCIKLIKEFNNNDIPLSILLLSEYWHIKDSRNMTLYRSGYTFNNNLFPEPKENIEEIHNYGVKLGLHLDPEEGIRKSEPAYNKLISSFDVKPGRAIPFNIMSKKFITGFISEIINPLMDLDVDFFWIDYANNLKTLEALNYYITTNYYKNKDKRPMVLSRNPLVAAHKYPVHYSGKTKVSWNTLSTLPFFNSNSSNIGLSWWSHDIGGYTGGIEDSELYLRYVQFSCFSPIFRFSSDKGYYYKREPWLWDMKTHAVTKKYCNLRHKLIPYLYSENYNYHMTGMPLVQPVYYTNPEIYDEPNYKSEYLFGSQFLISPITNQKDLVMNRSIEKIFLPEGVWYDYHNGKKFIGNKRFIVFYKDEDYPVFVKEGAIIPMAVLDENINSTENPKTIEIDIFPGKNNMYRLYEDDGISQKYESGNYFITSIEYLYLKNNYTVKIKPLEGVGGIIPKFRNYVIKFKNTRKPSSLTVSLNGDAFSKNVVAFESDLSFIVNINHVDTTKELIITSKGSNLEIAAQRIMNEDINSIISDLAISTDLKEEIADILFSKMSIKKKRIAINKLKRHGLDNKFAKMFLKLLEYSAEI